MSISRKFLLPLSPLYGLATKLRNLGYDRGIFKSCSYSLPVICVGNLSVGGTGKSPMVEYLINHFKKDHKVASLSRGYGRTTSGFYLLSESDSANRVGDEPLQFKIKNPEISVAVDENRQRGIAELLKKENPEVIILDDAFQHRKVKAGLNILLTTYGNIYTKDQLLPAGNLRESIDGAKRAQIIVVTKCPPDLSVEKQEEIARDLNLQPNQNLFFGYIDYSPQIFNDAGGISLQQIQGKQVLLVTGIANDKPLINHLKNENIKFDHEKFPDHYNYKLKDQKRISGEIILTTEKDYMRLKGLINHPQLYYIPIQFKFLKDGQKFLNLIDRFVLNEK